MQDDPKTTTNELLYHKFPSVGLLIVLYSLGALSGLLLAFLPSLNTLHSANCLILSWLMALCAFVFSVISDKNHAEADQEDLY